LLVGQAFCITVIQKNVEPFLFCEPSGIVAEGKLVQVPIEVFRGNEMVDTDDSTLQEREETLNCICMAIAVDVFPCGMSNDVVFVEPLDCAVCSKLVGHNGASEHNISGDERANRLLIDVSRRCGFKITFSFDYCEHRCLNFDASSLHSFSPFREMLVLFLASDVGFVYLNNILEGHIERFRLGRVTQTVKNEPSRLLGNAEVFAQLDGGNALFVGRNKVDRKEPFLERNFAVFKDAPDFGGELLPAVSTLVMNPVGEREDLTASAMRAIDTVFPTHCLEMFQTGLLVGKLFEKLNHVTESFHLPYPYFVHYQYTTKKRVSQIPNMLLRR
jgi:hypothetical protein